MGPVDYEVKTFRLRLFEDEWNHQWSATFITTYGNPFSWKGLQTDHSFKKSNAQRQLINWMRQLWTTWS